MPFFYGLDQYYIILVMPAMLVALWAQMRVKSTFAHYSKLCVRSGMTGAQAARRILDANGLSAVRIEMVSGRLSDHYDPTARIVRLSKEVYGQSTAAAVGIAAHEVGHAIQNAEGYSPLQLRNAIIPLTNIGSTLSIPMILLGIVMTMRPLIFLGVVLFSMATVFQLVTLPVEFNASYRAMQTLQRFEMVTPQEAQGVRSVLTAAALTYVAALLVSMANLFRMLLLLNDRGGFDRRD